jgi:hypothetical protein
MRLEIDNDKLRQIAQNSIEQEKTEKKRIRQEENDRNKAEKTRILQRAEEIIASIPSELEKASKHPKQVESGFAITARIPIVHENMFSVMVPEGSLSEKDEAILSEVREKIKTLDIPGVDSIVIDHYTRTHMYSDSDSSIFGDCKYYYIETKVILSNK